LSVPETPPADVAADPERLNYWNQMQEQSHRSDDQGSEVYELDGCGKHALYVCYHPTETGIRDAPTVGNESTTMGDDTPWGTVVLSAVQCKPAVRDPTPSELLAPSEQPGNERMPRFEAALNSTFGGVDGYVGARGEIEVKPWLAFDVGGGYGGGFGPSLSVAGRLQYRLLDKLIFGLKVGPTETFLVPSFHPNGLLYAGAPTVGWFFDVGAFCNVMFGDHFMIGAGLGYQFLLNQGQYQDMHCPNGGFGCKSRTGFEVNPWEITSRGSAATDYLYSGIDLAWIF
jgi:hypothetical protein